LVEKWFLLKTFLIIWLRAEQNQGVYGYVVFSRFNVLGVHGYVAFVTSFFTSPRPSPKEREPCRWDNFVDGFGREMVSAEDVFNNMVKSGAKSGRLWLCCFQ
jgi:hypothetical protein